MGKKQHTTKDTRYRLILTADQADWIKALAEDQGIESQQAGKIVLQAAIARQALPAGMDWQHYSTATATAEGLVLDVDGHQMHVDWLPLQR